MAASHHNTVYRLTRGVGRYGGAMDSLVRPGINPTGSNELRLSKTSQSGRQEFHVRRHQEEQV
jgi:hypothetical protein